MKITVAINTLNEEQNIAGCIQSVIGFADEILVCDMHSDDKTVEIARGLGARVIFYERTGFVEPARHFLISNATYDLVLVLDADERMTSRLQEKLRELSQDKEIDLVLFGVLFNYFGKYIRNGGFYNTRFPRFFKKKYYLETFDGSDLLSHQNFRSMERAKGYHVQLSDNYYILHEAYPTIEKYIQKTVGKYARIKSEELYQREKYFTLKNLISLPIWSFFQRFFLKRGYRDGVAGFLLCVYYAIYIFSIQANLWLLEQNQGKNESPNRFV